MVWLDSTRLDLTRQVIKDPDAENQIPTIRKAMENEHMMMKDSALSFSSSNGCTSTSQVEWEFVYCAQASEYPDRKGLAPDLQRKPIPIARFVEEVGGLKTTAEST